MPRQDLEDTFLVFAGTDSYRIPIDDVITLKDAADHAGQLLVRVLASGRCELMGAPLEPWRPLAVDSQDLWLWRLDQIERPTDLAPFEWPEFDD